MKKKNKSKNFWRITDQHRAEDWGNISLPHITDEQLHSPRANVRINNRRRAQGYDLHWSRNNSAKNRRMAQDPRWILSNAQKNCELAQDPKWLAATQKGTDARRARGAELKAAGKEEEFRALFGVKDRHSQKTKKKMSASASKRWARTQRPVSCEGRIYANKSVAAAALNCHPDTILYRIRTRPQQYHWVERSDSTEGAHG